MSERRRERKNGERLWVNRQPELALAAIQQLVPSMSFCSFDGLSGSYGSCPQWRRLFSLRRRRVGLDFQPFLRFILSLFGGAGECVRALLFAVGVSSIIIIIIISSFCSPGCNPCHGDEFALFLINSQFL